jgi:hypothetical protein
MDHAVEPALNAFAITFADRWPAPETLMKTPETPLLLQTRSSSKASARWRGGRNSWW